MSGSPWIAALNAHGVPAIAELLGLEAQGRAWGPCPSCGEARRGSSDPRPPIGLTPDGAGWRCQRCHAGGDAATIAALLVAGAAKPDAAGWARVRAWAAGRGLVAGGGSSTGTAEAVRPRPVPRAAAAPVTRPPDVLALWAACAPVVDDHDVAAWLVGRGLRPELIADLDLARALPAGLRAPAWAGTRRATWAESGHRLITPLHGPGEAAPVAVRARAIGPDPWRKALSPTGHSVAGLVFACPLARRLLASDATAGQLVGELGLVVTEGEPDFLTWATRAGLDGALERAPAVVGVESGAWSDELAALVPDATEVVVRTHLDDAGDRYAARINNTLGGRCRVLRAVAPAEEAAIA